LLRRRGLEFWDDLMVNPRGDALSPALRCEWSEDENTGNGSVGILLMMISGGVLAAPQTPR
ncbi:MAG: hypothetical protein PHQ81_00620, partial [Methanofollis sp.]|nr:hypothetical protein [Methanofollis sp.]